MIEPIRWPIGLKGMQEATMRGEDANAVTGKTTKSEREREEETWTSIVHILIGGHVVRVQWGYARGFRFIEKTTPNKRSPFFSIRFFFFFLFFLFFVFFGINFQSLSSPRLSLFYRCYITDSCNIECNAAWATKSTIWIPISCHFLISAWKVRTMHGKFPSGLTAKRRLETPRYRPRIIAFVYRLLEPRVFHISRRNRRNGIDTDIYFAYEILLGVLCCEYTFFRITRITYCELYCIVYIAYYVYFGSLYFCSLLIIISFVSYQFSIFWTFSSFNIEFIRVLWTYSNYLSMYLYTNSKYLWS